MEVTTEEEVRRVFDELDLDSNGNINLTELQKGMKAVGLRAESAQDLWSQIKQFDQQQDGNIDFVEFSAFVKWKERQLWEIFKKIDTSEDGQLDVAEVTLALNELGLHAAAGSVARLLQQADEAGNQDGLVDFAEFRRMTLLFPSNRLVDIFNAQDHAFNFGYYSIPRASTQKSSHSPLAIFLSGAVAGLISRTVTAPADRVKVLLQSNVTKLSIGETVTQVMQKEGVRAFWRGNLANVLKIMPESAGKFYFNDVFKSRLIHDPDRAQPYEYVAAGALAGVCSQTCVYPMEIIKTRLATSTPGTYSGIIGCGRAMVEQGGVRSLYRGLLASNLGIIPYAGVDLGVYGVLKDRWFRAYPGEDPTWWQLLLMGSTASFSGQLIAYPLQLVRTRLQTGGIDGRPNYTGITHVFRDVLAKEGPRGLYRGIGANFLKGVPAVSIGYLAYENSIKVFGPLLDS